MNAGAAEGTFKDGLVASVLLEPRSLLVFQDSAYTHYLHGIDEVRTSI